MSHDHGHDHDHDHHHDLGHLVIPAQSRTRRTRMNEPLRSLVRETTLHPSNFVLPMFVTEGPRSFRREIQSMPGIHQLGMDGILADCERAAEAGLGGIILFGIPEAKDPHGHEGLNPEGVVQLAIQEIKGKFPDLLVITDVCLCEYTDHGHCGIVNDTNGSFEIVNDETVEHLVQMALSHVEAGADMVAPSDMMDGRIGAIREALDMTGKQNVPIMAYSAKYASGFYGPFREAAESAPKFGDRRSHQMDPANSDEALRVVQRDIDEGADIVMIKPAMPALDIIRRVYEKFHVPTAAYQVSGEYAMMKAAAANGWIDEDRVMMESLTAIKRAGASIILTYYALEAARILKRH